MCSQIKEFYCRRVILLHLPLKQKIEHCKLSTKENPHAVITNISGVLFYYFYKIILEILTIAFTYLIIKFSKYLCTRLENSQDMRRFFSFWNIMPWIVNTNESSWSFCGINKEGEFNIAPIHFYSHAWNNCDIWNTL